MQWLHALNTDNEYIKYRRIVHKIHAQTQQMEYIHRRHTAYTPDSHTYMIFKNTKYVFLVPISGLGYDV